MRFNMGRFVIWVTAIMAVSFICAGIVLMVTGNFSIAVEQIDDSKTFEAEDINKITMNITSTDINIIPSEDDYIKVHFYGEVSTNRNRDIPSLVAYESGDELRIEIIKPQTFFIGINVWRTALDIYIPEDSLELLKIDAVSSDIDVSDLKVNEFEYTGVSGDLKGENIFAENIKINTTSGDISINGYTGDLNIHVISGDLALKDGSINDDIELTTISGDVYIEQEDPSNMDINTTSGDVGIMISKDAGFYLKTSTVSGEIDNRFPIEITSSGRRSLEGMVGSGEKEIVVSTTSGDIKVYY
jgi:lia operon protein LiaG